MTLGEMVRLWQTLGFAEAVQYPIAAWSMNAVKGEALLWAQVRSTLVLGEGYGDTPEAALRAAILAAVDGAR